MSFHPSEQIKELYRLVDKLQEENKHLKSQQIIQRQYQAEFENIKTQLTSLTIITEVQ